MSGWSRLPHAPAGVMLTDEESVIVSYVGDARVAQDAYVCALCEGAVWSEAEQGINGMGTRLTLREPVLIQRAEHRTLLM